MAGGKFARPRPQFLKAAIALAGGWRPIGVAMLYTAAINCLALTGPAYMLLLYDRVLPSGGRAELLAATGIMLVLYALSACVDIARQGLLMRCAHLARRRVSSITARKLASGPAGELKAIDNVLRSQVPAAVCDAPLVPLYLLVLSLLHPLLCALATAGAASIVGCVHLIARDGGNGDAAARANILVASILRALRPALQSTMLGLGAYLVMVAQSHPASILAAAIVLPRVLGPVETIAAHHRSIAAARLAAERLAELLRTPSADANDHRTEAIERQISATGVKIILRRSGDYARKATRGGAKSMSSDLRPTAQ